MISQSELLADYERDAVNIETVSGRELDAMVAERVMGWQRMPDATALAPFAYKRPDGHIVHPYSAPEYSKSIVAAMEVVDFLCPSTEAYNAGRKSCRFIITEQDNGRWHVEARSPYLTSYSKPAFADSYSLPEAICRAALEAVTREPATTSA